MAAFNVGPQFGKAFFHEFLVEEIPLGGCDPVEYVHMNGKAFPVNVPDHFEIFVRSHGIHPGHGFYGIEGIPGIHIVDDLLNAPDHILPRVFGHIFPIGSIPPGTFGA